MAGPDDFEVPRLDALLQRARDTIQALVTGASLNPGADYDILSKVLATLEFPLFGFIRFCLQQVFPNTASSKYVARHGELRDIEQKQAKEANGYGLLRGTTGATQPINSTLTDAQGITFETQAPATIATALWSNRNVLFFDSRRPNTVVISSTTGIAVGDVFGIGGNFYAVKALPGGGQLVIFGRFKVPPNTVTPDFLFPASGALLPIKSVETGANKNFEYATILTLATPATFIDPEVEVLEVGGGADIESPEDWARRMQEADAERQSENNRSRALQIMLDELGVGEAYVYDVYRGLGTADLVPQGVQGARHLGAARIALMQTEIAPQPPTDLNPGLVGIGGHDWLFTDFADFFIIVDLILTGGPGYGPDWIGTLTVDVASTTTRVNTTTDPRPFVAIGSRVVIPVGTRLLEQRTINSLDAAGFGLDSALPAAPAAGKIVYPGSNLVPEVRDAVLDAFDNLGPGDTSPPTRYPAPTTRGPDKLSLNLIHAVVRGVTGVDNLAIVSPPVDVTPPPKAQCAPLELIIRYA